MINQITERDLVVKFREARLAKKAAETALEEANRIYMDAESALIESLQARDADATARYEGVGYVSLAKPRLYARFDKEVEPQVFEYLKTQERSDLIKETVNPASLSGFVGEKLGQGEAVPEFIKYYLKASVRFYE
jgi:hypothetical protein